MSRGRATWFHPLTWIVVLASGALMVRAGVLGADDGWAAARPFLLGGGIAINLAFLGERHGVRSGRLAGRASGVRRIWLRLSASAVILGAGALMVWSGHLLASDRPLLAALVATAGIAAVLPALALNRASTREPSAA